MAKSAKKPSKSRSSIPAHDRSTKIKYPSAFGSHKSMVDEAATAELDDPKKVVCVDSHGPYVTERWRLDSGLADPNRYRQSRIKEAGDTEGDAGQ